MTLPRPENRYPNCNHDWNIDTDSCQNCGTKWYGNASHDAELNRTAHRAFNEGQQSMIDAEWRPPDAIDVLEDALRDRGWVRLPSVEEMTVPIAEQVIMLYSGKLRVDGFIKWLHDWLKG